MPWPDPPPPTFNALAGLVNFKLLVEVYTSDPTVLHTSWVTTEMLVATFTFATDHIQSFPRIILICIHITYMYIIPLWDEKGLKLMIFNFKKSGCEAQRQIIILSFDKLWVP